MNEKENLQKADEINDADVTDILDAVAEVMGVEPEEEEKRKQLQLAGKGKAGPCRRKPYRKKPYRENTAIFFWQSLKKQLAERRKPYLQNVMLARSIKCIDIWGKTGPGTCCLFRPEKLW
ncbi:MAG: hypothetical protein ACLVAW_17765 [Eisenbergiella massiliensis]